ncbi:MAG: sodium/proline symporter, partial [Ulvibacter sp.]
MIISFVFFLLIFVIIGVLSTVVNKHTSSDYLLANHSVKPWLVALSAVATNNSGFMFIGMIGYTYSYGISSIWLMIGWIAGDFVSSLFIHKKLRITTKNKGVLSFAGAISKWGNFDYKKLRIYLGVITIIFLGIYAAAQLNAGSKALHILFGWDYKVGAIVGATIVLLYCFAGGIRASIWTDAAQSFVMIFAMGLLCITAISEIGGISDLLSRTQSVSNDYISLFPQNLEINSFIGPLLFVLGWFFAGIGVIGQPHIMVRFMAMDQPNNITKVRGYYYSFYTLFYVLTILVGITARILLPDVNNFDAELALPTLANSLLPEILVGLILAGLFAATMSTADSQILSCTAAVTCDFKSGKKLSYLMTKLVTVF